MKKRKVLICISGFPGAGKGVFMKAANKFGIKTLVMGDYIRRKAEEIYGQSSLENIKKVMVELRRAHGNDIVAKFLANDLNKITDEFVIIDGVRSVAEINYLKNIGNVILIWVHASSVARYKRLIRRGREDDIKNIQDFIEREEKERNIGLNKLMEIADIYFINENIDENTAIDLASSIISLILKNFSEKWIGK